MYRICTQQNNSELIIHITYKVACILVATAGYNKQALDSLNGIKSTLLSGQIYLKKSKIQRLRQVYKGADEQGFYSM